MADRIALALKAELTHPFLFAGSTDLASLHQRAAHEPLASYVSQLRASLDQQMREPLADCPEGGMRPHPDYYPQTHRINDVLQGAAVMWHVDGDPRWAEMGRTALRRITSWPYWRAANHLPLNCDLSTGYTALSVAIAYDLLYTELDDPLRETVQQAMLTHVLPFVVPEAIDRSWWSYAHDGNWSFVVLGGCGLACLAMLPERPEFRVGLETIAGHLQRSLDHIQPQGGWREGYSYLLYGKTPAHLLIDGLLAAGDDALARHPGFEALDDFFLFNELTPTGPVYFGDCGPTGLGGAIVYRRAAVTRRGDLQHFADRHGGGGPLGILWRDPDVQPVAPHFDPPSRVWGEIGWAICRDAWDDPDGVVLATKAGSTAGGHQHPDCGTFLLAAYGKELISEPGIGHYDRDYHRGRTPIKRSSAHNCLMFDEQEQVSREFKGGAITQFVSHPTYDAVKMELAGAYDHPDLQRWDRYFFLLRPGLVVLVDEVRARHGHRQFVGTTVDSRLHTFGEVTLRDTDAVIDAGGASLLVKPLLPPMTPGLGDMHVIASVGQHEGLQTRHPAQQGPIPYLNLRTNCEMDPTVLVTVLSPGRSLEEAEARWATVHVESRRRRRLELFYAGQTLVIDWGNRRWQIYWNVVPGRTPRVLEATVGGPMA